jgi:hypothetical protein
LYYQTGRVEIIAAMACFLWPGLWFGEEVKRLRETERRNKQKDAS